MGTGVPRNAIDSNARDHIIARARHIAMTVARRATPCSYPAIARQFGRDHSTVYTRIKRIESQAMDDADLAELLENLTATALAGANWKDAVRAKLDKAESLAEFLEMLGARQ